MDERLSEAQRKVIYRSLVTLPRIVIAAQFLVIVILVVMVVQ